MPSARTKDDPKAHGDDDSRLRRARIPGLMKKSPRSAEELLAEMARMERAIEVAEAGLADLFEEGTDGAGRDPADVGSSNFERDQEMSLAQNAREMLEQAELACGCSSRRVRDLRDAAVSRSARAGCRCSRARRCA